MTVDLIEVGFAMSLLVSFPLVRHAPTHPHPMWHNHDDAAGQLVCVDNKSGLRMVEKRMRDSTLGIGNRWSFRSGTRSTS